MKKNKKLMGGLAVAMSLVLIASASFAWFTSKDEKVNHFETKQITDGSVTLVEIFTPPTDWKPGQEVIKNVSAANVSESDALVRISFEEILKKLSNNGKVVTDTAPGHAGYLPVHVGIDAYTGWTKLTATDINGSLPGGVVIYRNGGTDPASGKTVYSYFTYYDLGDGSYQKLTATIKPNGNKVDVTDILYYYFEGKTTYQADWAGINVKVTAPVVHPLNTVFNFPTKTAPLATDSKIKLKFDALTETMTNNNWWYNQADGYFYYIGKLVPGQISEKLLDTVTLDGSADNAYALMELDMVVLLEAIQNTPAAMTATDGWALTDAALIAKLTEFCN